MTMPGDFGRDRRRDDGIDAKRHMPPMLLGRTDRYEDDRTLGNAALEFRPADLGKKDRHSLHSLFLLESRSRIMEQLSAMFSRIKCAK